MLYMNCKQKKRFNKKKTIPKLITKLKTKIKYLQLLKIRGHKN